MGRKSILPNVVLSRMPASKAGSIVIGVCCFAFTIVFYATTHLTSIGSFMTECSSGVESTSQYQQFLLWSLQDPSKKASVQGITHHAAQKDLHKSSKPAKGRKQKSKIAIQVARIAHDATVQLQYAINSSTISIIEGPNLFSMAKHVSTFTRLLEALLVDPSIDRKPFLDLRERYFGWWKPSNSTHIPWDAKNHTTGIVLTAGQANIMFAAHAIRTLRRVVGTTLPIQVAYAGEDDLPERNRQQIKALDPNIELINVLDFYDESVAGLRGGGYAMKPFAALASSFEKVIIIDADTIFMQRPDDWFETNAGLKKTGTLFFHDRAFIGRKTTDWIKDLLEEGGREPSPTLNSSMFWQEELEHQQESGVVFFNKAIPGAFMSLIFTTYMNALNVRAQLYGQVFGDKETFWLAAELANIRYTFHPSYAGIIGPISLNAEGLPEVCSPQPLQTDLDGRPFWFNSGILEDKTNANNQRYANLTHYIPGPAHEQPEGGWRYIFGHTYCTGRNLSKILSVKDAGLEEVATNLVAEARTVENMLQSGSV